MDKDLEGLSTIKSFVDVFLEAEKMLAEKINLTE